MHQPDALTQGGVSTPDASGAEDAGIVIERNQAFKALERSCASPESSDG